MPRAESKMSMGYLPIEERLYAKPSSQTLEG